MHALFTVTLTMRTDLSGSFSMSLLRDDTVVILGEERNVKKLRQYTIPNGQEVCVVDVNDKRHCWQAKSAWRFHMGWFLLVSIKLSYRLDPGLLILFEIFVNNTNLTFLSKK